MSDSTSPGVTSVTFTVSSKNRSSCLIHSVIAVAAYLESRQKKMEREREMFVFCVRNYT
jgi:hypothetical protein